MSPGSRPSVDETAKPSGGLLEKGGRQGLALVGPESTSRSCDSMELPCTTAVILLAPSRCIRPVAASGISKGRSFESLCLKPPHFRSLTKWEFPKIRGPNMHSNRGTQKQGHPHEGRPIYGNGQIPEPPPAQLLSVEQTAARGTGSSAKILASGS